MQNRCQFFLTLPEGVCFFLCEADSGALQCRLQISSGKGPFVIHGDGREVGAMVVGKAPWGET